MENELLGIGRLAALSGLTISALRFYDGAQVLTPALVDPSSGYRYYRPDQVIAARLIARLRRVSLPLDDIRTIVTDPSSGPAILAAHLERLEAGLSDARKEISTVIRQLENPEIPLSHFTLPAADLVRALSDVRYAVGSDPEVPMLHGVFLDTDADLIRLVATDRFRLATAIVPNPDGGQVSTLLPTTAVDELLATAPTGDLLVTVTGDEITLSGSGRTVSARLPGTPFPPYRPWLELGRTEVAVDAESLRRALQDGPTELRQDHGLDYHLSVLSIGPDGVTVATSDDPDATAIGVNREFLLQALDIGDQLTLGLDGPITPLAIRTPDRRGTFSILMPVRLDQPA